LVLHSVIQLFVLLRPVNCFVGLEIVALAFSFNLLDAEALANLFLQVFLLFGRRILLLSSLVATLVRASGRSWSQIAWVRDSIGGVLGF